MHPGVAARASDIYGAAILVVALVICDRNNK